MAEYLVQDTTLTAIADAVRAKKGTTEPIALTDLANEIESIQSGGGSASNKLALIVGTQSENNPYDITASDLEGVTAITQYAFCYREGLRSIALPTNCTSIGQYAFRECSNLTSVDMPNVTSIGQYAFEHCLALTSVNMPNVTSIGQYAFEHCLALTSVNMPNVTSIGQFAFRECSNLTSVDMPNVTSIGQFAFRECSNLTSVDMPNVKAIGISVFDNCRSLTSISMPNVTSLDGSAFYRCTSLTSISMPSVTSIGPSAFNHCSKLTSLTIPSTCTSIWAGALKCGSSTNMCTFTFEGRIPPSIETTTFNESYINKIIVPVGCGERYKTATNWSNFASYIEEATE